jgi:hypothetical protein
MQDDNGDTPMSLAAAVHTAENERTLKRFIEACPDAISIANELKVLPIHTICNFWGGSGPSSEGTTEAFGQLLSLSKDRGLLLTTCTTLDLPLHVACMSLKNHAIIKTVLDVCPEATRELNAKK